ncbi:MAG: hypothetical protein K2J08_04555 [Ruminococcus sp.]|nr:hypothetical protein [Ruminococcus sp.]
MSEKSKKTFIFLKTLLAVLTLIYPLFNVIMTGTGLVYNHENYGRKITLIGIFLIVSGLLMTVGTLLCISGKKFSNMLSAVFSASGFMLCMALLNRLIAHADRNGWTDKFKLTPVSDMYRIRIIPVAVPFALTLFISLVQYFSADKTA